MNNCIELVSTEGYKLPLWRNEYLDDSFDISVQSEGINSGELTKFISDNCSKCKMFFASYICFQCGSKIREKPLILYKQKGKKVNWYPSKWF